MSDIRPFKAFRPAHDKVFHVVTRSAEGFTPATIRHVLMSNPYSFLNIIFPDFLSKERTRAHSPERMQKIREAFDQFISKKNFIQDPDPSYYIYRQIQPRHTFTGIIGLIHVSEYTSGRIKIHEHTLLEKEQKLMQYLDRVEWNSEPVMFFHDSRLSLQQWLYDFTRIHSPAYDFSTTDGNRHLLWIVHHSRDIQCIRDELSALPEVYVADGHHRTASSVLLAQKRRSEGEDEYALSGFFMGIFFDAQELKVYEYNRLIDAKCPVDPLLFFKKLAPMFDIEEIKTPSAPPVRKSVFYVYTRQQWYSLTMKKDMERSEHLPFTSAGILNDFILTPVLGIQDSRKDKKVQYLSGIFGAEGIVKEVDSGKYIFGIMLCPSSTREIKEISLRGEVMPPKSTWIEPKLLNGLIIYDFSRHS